jgi:hypothetical protein
LLLDEAVGVAETLDGVGDGDTVGDAVTVTVVAGAVVVTVTVGLAGAVTVGVAGVVTVGLAVEVVSVAAAAGSERLAKLLITLEALLPMLLEQPADRHTTSRMAAARKRLLVGRRMLLPPLCFAHGRPMGPVPRS